MSSRLNSQIADFIADFMPGGAEPRRCLIGADGVNRAVGVVNQLDVNDDLSAVNAWLQEYQDSDATQRAYRAEVERLLMWSLLERGKPLSSLLRPDFQAFEEFLKDPPGQWCNAAKPPRRLGDGRPNPAWRPFAGGLRPENVDRALRIINSLLTFLVSAGYLAANPLALRRRSAVRRQMGEGHAGPADPARRAFDREQWGAVIATLEAMPQESERDVARYERMRYVLALFYNLGGRISELTSHTMGSFHEVGGRWRWYVVGKGGRAAWVPVNTPLFDALVRYRRHLGLPDTPAPGDPTPLVLDLCGVDGISTRQIYNIVKELFAKAAERLPGYKGDALRRASPHWLRHTMLTHLAEHLKEHPVRLKQVARHGRFETTLIYINPPEDSLYDTVELLAEAEPVGEPGERRDG